LRTRAFRFEDAGLDGTNPPDQRSCTLGTLFLTLAAL
jgi:hypothetical protein